MTAAKASAADKALAERARLARNYNAAKRREFNELCAMPVHGPLLYKFNATLDHFDIEDADRMIAYVQQRNRAWLRSAPDEIRRAALHLISERIIKIRERAGLPALDDPMPGEDDDVFRLCRKELGL